MISKRLMEKHIMDECEMKLLVCNQCKQNVLEIMSHSMKGNKFNLI